MSMRGEADFVRNTVKEHTKWFEDSIPMIASENLISPLAREMMVSDFCDRYAEGLPGDRYYNGNIYVDKVELKAMELARKLFNSKMADVRPISGTVANMAMLFAFAKPGDTITTTSLDHGAHISTAKFGAVGVRGVSTVTYPFDTENMVIDIDGTRKTLLEVRPKLALFGQSVFLFPTPIKELQDTFQEIGCHVWYDAAHVLGLIAGGKFQDPLREGAEFISGSTHKTLPGPQRGIIVGNPKDEDAEKRVYRAVFPGVTSNHHLHTMAALAITLAEHIEFGKNYANQVVTNARALGQAMHEEGFKVLCEHRGFTESHTIAVDVRDHGGGAVAAQRMEDSNIIANKNMLPGDTKPKSPSGIRLGAQEMTRIGMGPSEMKEVAKLIKRIVITKEAPATVKPDVKALKSLFSTIQYCFEPGRPGYKFHELI
ncbi:MAG: serine hydroxymethyltransferase [Methanobacteriota archaeon]